MARLGADAGADALREGLRRTYMWIKDKLEAELAEGTDNRAEYSSSVPP